MNWTDFFQGVGLLVVAVVSGSFLVVAFHLARADRSDYDRNRERSPRRRDPLAGTLRAEHDGERDFRVRAGLAVRKRDQSWVEQAMLSNEAVDSLRHTPR